MNRAPIFIPVGSVSIEEGHNLKFTVAATDPDGDAIAYSSTPLPAGASFDPVNRIFDWTPDFTQAGVYDVTFYATDDGAPPETGETTVFITVGNTTSPTALNDFLLETILGLNLRRAVENSYLANLKKVTIFIERGMIRPAKNQVLAFIGKVESDLYHGFIDPGSGELLLDLGWELLALLESPVPPGEGPNFDGSYSSCNPDEGVASSQRRQLTISGTSAFQIDTDYLGVMDCSGSPSTRVEITFTLSYDGAKSVTLDGATVTAEKATVLFTSLTLAWNDEVTVAFFNSVGAFGYSDWEVGIAKDIFQRDFDGSTIVHDPIKAIIYLDQSAEPDRLYDGDEPPLDAEGYPNQFNHYFERS